MADEFFAALQQQLGGESVAHDAAVTGETVTRQSSAIPALEPQPAMPSRPVWPEGRLAPELYRVGWFALGVVTTLVLTHLA